MAATTVIIPVFNKWELTRNCLRSLAEHSPAELRVVVADNASTDETAAHCEALGRELFGDRFRLLRFESNLNFGPACNAAARAAESDLLFFLNNDTVLTANWLPPLLRSLADNPGAAGAGPLLTYADDTVQHLGVAIWPAGDHITHLYAHLPASHPLARKRRRFPVITAAALLLPRQTFLDAGGFDEGYVNGFEDVDLCLRICRQGGFFTVEPESRIFHLESQTRGVNPSEEHNSMLLHSRWNLAGFSNLATLAREDGYDLRVDVNCQILFTPAQARRKDLLARWRSRPGFDPAFCWNLLQEEPFWEEGYALFGNMLENAGQHEAAFMLHSSSLVFVPSFAAYERAMAAGERLASIQGDMPENMALLRKIHAEERAFILDEAAYDARLTQATTIIAAHGDDTLADAYRRAGQEATALRSRLLPDKTA